MGDIFKPSDGRIAGHNPCKMRPLPGPGEASPLRWRKDGDSAFFGSEGARKLDERALTQAGPTRAKVWPAGGRDQVWYVLQSSGQDTGS